MSTSTAKRNTTPAPTPGMWPVLTPDGREQLLARIEHIRDIRLPELRPLLTERERDERDVHEFERLLGELGNLETIVASADVIDHQLDAFDGRLGLGMRARVTLADGSDTWVRPVHPVEAHLDEERISMDSPLAKAVIGARVGDLTWVGAPTGVWASRVLEIDPTPGATVTDRRS